jgi:hypothetical protein
LPAAASSSSSSLPSTSAPATTCSTNRHVLCLFYSRRSHGASTYSQISTQAASDTTPATLCRYLCRYSTYFANARTALACISPTKQQHSHQPTSAALLNNITSNSTRSSSSSSTSAPWLC